MQPSAVPRHVAHEALQSLVQSAPYLPAGQMQAVPSSTWGEAHAVQLLTVGPEQVWQLASHACCVGGSLPGLNGGSEPVDAFLDMA